MRLRSPNRRLEASQVQLFQRATALFREGKAPQALALARQLAIDASASADAHQLLGMCLAEAGDPEADRAFRTALDLAPGNELVSLNFAAWLGRSGREAEALRVLDEAPDTARTSMERGRLAARVGEYARSRDAFAQAVSLQPDSYRAWHGLGSALRALGELEAALDAYRRAAELAPGNAPVRVNLGAVLRLLGRSDEALEWLREAGRLGHEGPELQDAIAGCLQDLGLCAEALAEARELVRRHPAYAGGYSSLSHLLWEHGDELAPGEDPWAATRQAIRAQPVNRDLHLRFAGMLTSAGQAEEALQVLEPLRGQDDPVVAWFRADALDRLGEGGQASLLYASAFRFLGSEHPSFLNAYARHALRSGRPELAESLAAAVVALDPSNQEGWSHLGTCWRLAGDPRESWLCDYERFVGELEVPVPAGFEDMDAFLSSLDACLAGLHLARREPVNQSVRNGSQTSGRLFGRRDPLLAATEASLRQAVQEWLQALPEDASHPFLRRRGAGVRFVGSWSVRLRASGRHSNHIHTEGWASSAFYVALPPSMRGADGQDLAGWLQLGQPLEDLGLDLGPRRLVRPRPGRLVLFPSYFWHGTLPFDGSEPRVTIAFDMQPA